MSSDIVFILVNYQWTHAEPENLITEATSTVCDRHSLFINKLGI